MNADFIQDPTLWQLIGGFLAALAIVLTALALGAPVVARCRLRRQPVDAGLIAVTLGLNLCSLAMLLFGYVGFPPIASLRLLLMVGLASGCLVLLRRPGLACVVRHLGKRKRLLLLSPLLLLPLGKALTWPIGWDELVYHLAVPQRWLADGAAHVYTDNPYSALPSGMDLLYTLALAVGDLNTPGSLNYLVWLLCLGLLYRLLRGKCRPLTAAVLTVSFAYSTVCLTLVYETYVELFLLANVLAALLLLRHYQAANSRPAPILLSGVFVGFACGVKLTGVVLAAALAPLLYSRFRQVKPRTMIVALLLCLGIIGVYYARPWQATGNPLYPYYAKVFTPTNELANQVSTYHHQLTTARYGAKTALQTLASPITLAWMKNRYDGALGWQWLPILLLAAIGTWRQRHLRPYAVAGVACYAVWLLSSQQSRFVLPAAVFGYLLAARLLDRSPTLLKGFLLWGILGLGLWSSGFGDPRLIKDQWSVVLGRATMAEYVEPWIGYDYASACAVTGALDGKVLVLMEKRAFYIGPHASLGTPFLQETYLTPPASYAAPDRLMAHLRHHNIDYLLIGLPARDPDKLTAYQQRLDSLIHTIGEARRQGLLIPVWQEAPYLLLRVP